MVGAPEMRVLKVFLRIHPFASLLAGLSASEIPSGSRAKRANTSTSMIRHFDNAYCFSDARHNLFGQMMRNLASLLKRRSGLNAQNVDGAPPGIVL